MYFLFYFWDMSKWCRGETYHCE